MILLLLAAIAQPEAQTPREFVESLYAAYADSDFSPFKEPNRIFTSRLVAALDEDLKLADGEVGYLDGDPICQCQDAEGLRATVVSVSQAGSDAAVVSVSIGLFGYEPRPATLSLVRTAAGWRIDDVSSPDEPSLLRAIEQSNKEAREAKR